MAISYNGLWELLIDKGMKKTDPVENENIGISSSTLAKMSRRETVSMGILERICMELDYDFEDLIHCKKDESKK
ncbi:MAG: helix-turn-helix transcriptional regulator [Lachnospiraceae bacterium]|nr:helix-turn-helix transcriptional regulator [Lachnospiraceae bacterium]